MKIAELRQKSQHELYEMLKEKKERVNELSFLLRQKKVKNVKEKKGIKRDIARILTILKTETSVL